jgi:3'(2'), 5'-bisphosphate nucleotidase
LVAAWKHEATSEPVAIHVAAFAADRPLRVMGSRSHGGAELHRWLQAIGIAHELVSAGSSLKLCRVAEGAADIYPRFGPTSQWDTAAGQCVVEQAGGAVVAMGGGAITYGQDQPVLNPYFAAVGDPRILALLDSSVSKLG